MASIQISWSFNITYFGGNIWWNCIPRWKVWNGNFSKGDANLIEAKNDPQILLT